MATPRSPRVLVAGGGIAALELVLALRATAGDAVEITLVSPSAELLVRPETTLEPFTRAARRYPLADLAAALDVRLVVDRVSAVEPGFVELGSGRDLVYDELVIAPGAHAEPEVEHATTIRAEDADALEGVVGELERGDVGHVVLVAGPRCGWALPVYELAFLLAQRSAAMGLGGRVTLVTHERRPLGIFRGTGSDAVAAALDAAGVHVLTDRRSVRRTPHGLLVEPGHELLPADRVLALPALSGPGIRGLPLTDGGFVAVDATFAVPGREDVHAIGDAADHPVKQGGLAAQQADAVAAGIAARAGVPGVTAPRFRGVLRATLITGARDDDRLYLAGTLVGGEVAESAATRVAPGWAGPKLAAERLSPFLADADARGVEAAAMRLRARGAVDVSAR